MHGNLFLYHFEEIFKMQKYDSVSTENNNIETNQVGNEEKSLHCLLT